MIEYGMAKTAHQLDVSRTLPEWSDRSSDAVPAVHPLLAQYLDASRPSAAGAASGAHVEMKEKGQIQGMSFPAGWTDGHTDAYTGIGHRSYSEVQLSGDKDVAVSFYYRGLPLKDANQANAFHELVSQPPHTLSATELKGIGEVLGDKANINDFNLLSARTENVNGKNVLIVEGRYKALQQDVYHMYVDADGSGKNIQEVFYQAPKDKFSANFKSAKSAFSSIKWKPPASAE